MKFTFVPEYRFDKSIEVSADFLVDIGVKGIILDIDNTLEPYENDFPSEAVVLWLNSLRNNGIAVAFVSNNNKMRVERFNKNLGFPAFYKAGKPFKKNILLAMAKINTTCENTVLMGDQVFTDVWAAHNSGIRAILVPPINDKRDLLTKFKRWLEKPILKKYDLLHNKSANER